MADTDINKSTSKLLSFIQPSDSIRVKVSAEALFKNEYPIDLGIEYTDPIWKIDFKLDLKDKGLKIKTLASDFFKDSGNSENSFKLPESIGNISLDDIRVDFFGGGELKGLLFGIGGLSFIYVENKPSSKCWGLVHEEPIDIQTSGMIAHLIGPKLTLQNLFIGNISGSFGELHKNITGQFNESRLLLGEKQETVPTGFVGGITIMGLPIDLPFSMDEQKTTPAAEKHETNNALKPTGSGNTQGSNTGSVPSIPDSAPVNVEHSGSMRKWFKLDKTISILHVGRVGCEWIEGCKNFSIDGNQCAGCKWKWKDSRIGLLLDADVNFGGLHLGMSGFEVSIPPCNLKPENIKVDIDGIDISYQGGPVSISGAFLKSEVKTVNGTKIVQYDGMARIKASDFTITGMGSYALVENHPSLFIYAILHKTLGGPTFFKVNGLAAGFGYNRTLKLPPIEEVQNFPLVRAALDENYLQGNAIQDAMLKLHDYIQPSLGDYWFAIGIRFSSFEMIQSFALLSVSFGHEVVIALLGLSRMTIPNIPNDAEKGKTIAYAELALKAVIKPEEGTITLEGRLTSESYIFSKDCHLTGGFAFYMWLSGEHAGDFVITLGGYHPKFVRPAHYPVVPRLGINWKVNNELTITSELYFALTPSCIMAGGKLSAVYQSGCIRAWFIAYVDFLLNWKPLYYLADMGISIGVEARIRINLGLFKISFSIAVHLNVALHIWGPPFAGVIEVDLTVITLTIRFGQAKAPVKPLLADEFVESFLPKQGVITTQINSGLIRETKCYPDFIEEEFKGKYSIDKLSQEIKKAIPKCQCSTIKELNVVLESQNLLDDLIKGGEAGIEKSKEKLNKLKEANKKNQNQEALKKVNREAIETAFSEVTPKNEIRVVTAHNLSFTIQSIIPVTEFTFTGMTQFKPLVTTNDLGIKPMGKTTLKSAFIITIEKIKKNDTDKIDLTNIRIDPLKANVPDALWGKSPKEGEVALPSSPEAKCIKACVGLRISFDPTDPDGSLPAMKIKNFAYENLHEKDISLSGSSSAVSLENDMKSIRNAMEPKIIEKRNELLAVLKKQGQTFDFNVDVSRMVEAGDSYFQAESNN